jgi:hypothetical protein
MTVDGDQWINAPDGGGGRLLTYTSRFVTCLRHIVCTPLSQGWSLGLLQSLSGHLNQTNGFSIIWDSAALPPVYAPVFGLPQF